MSTTLQKARAYLQFILDKRSSITQIRWLLRNPTDHQLLALSEIAYNLTFNNSVLSPKARQELKYASRLLGELGKKERSLAAKRRLIRKHTGTVVKVIQYLHKFLLSVIT